MKLIVSGLFCLAVLTGQAMAGIRAVERPFVRTEVREPCVDHQVFRRPFFGDLHIHTRLSLDAAMQDTRTGPEEAYGYARGSSISIPPYGDEEAGAREATIGRSIDFAGVTDHAEMYGETRICHTPGMEGYWSFACMGLRWLPSMVGIYFMHEASNGVRLGFCGDEGEICADAAMGPWQDIQAAAESAYDRSEGCEFTSFVAYEWTGTYMGDKSDVANLHRNVIFRNAEVPERAGSFIDFSTPPELWKYLQQDCREKGQCDAVVIPHNSNISLGRMFDDIWNDGSLVSSDDAQKRQEFETLVEMIQHKGSSECFSGAGNADEACDFEQLPWNSFTGNTFESRAKPLTADAGFVREVLKEGIAQQAQSRINPYKFGFIGSTDTHRALAGGVEEMGFPGHGGAGNAAVAVGAEGLPDEWEFNPGGLAVLYAEENSRDALFASMQRRESYATSGTRIGVRFFGGWDFPEDMCGRDDLVALGYQRGVPMGADLREAQEGQTPVFVVSASRDPGTLAAPGVDLQRVELIKGWVEADGSTHERVVNIAGDADNGSSVDINTCEPVGTGAKTLCSIWSDPEFDASQGAFYYARVLENPSCRWSTYVCNAQQIDCSNPDRLSDEAADCCRPEMPKTIQERAWTSPIWYSAGGE